MKSKCRMAAAASIGVLAMYPSVASADLIGFAPFSGPAAPDGSGPSLSMEATDSGSWVDFRFRNDSAASWVVTALYLESNPALAAILGDGEIVSPQGAGLDFRLGASPSHPPAEIAILGGAWNGNFFAAKAEGPKLVNGIGPGESLLVRFELLGSFTGLMDGLAGEPGGFRVVQRSEIQGGAQSTWSTNQAVPAPSAGVAAMLGLFWMGRRRRRSGATAQCRGNTAASPRTSL